MPKVPVEMVPVAKLAPHPRNPNVGDIDAIRESIRENEWFGTVVADRRTGRILAGEHRWKAAEAEGLDAVPVYWVESRDDEHATRIMLADNRTAQLAHYDDEALAGLLSELAAADQLAGSGCHQLRYVHFLDPSWRERLAVPVLSYQQIEARGASMYRGKSRAGNVDSDVPAFRAGEGGAIPTPALHRSESSP